MKTIYIFTEDFPFGESETTFLSNELSFLSRKYKIVILCTSATLNRSSIKNKNKGYDVIYVPMKKVDCLSFLWAMFSLFFDKDFNKEIQQIWFQKQLFWKRIIKSIYFYAQGVFLFKDAMNCCNTIDENDLLYSYWYGPSAMAAIKIRNQTGCKVITRTHGYDLYNERVSTTLRQPFKTLMDEKIDYIIFACEYAKKYYLKHFAHSEHGKYRIGIIGAPKADPKGNTSFDKNRESICLVSCSTVSKIKRIHLIIDALSILDGYDIYWNHFGDGEMMNEIQELAKEKLEKSTTIHYSFEGQVTRERLYQFYQENDVDLFITTSESEGGCPISIQEAMAFGIPTICTSVGGITEMIDGNGWLLTSNNIPDELSERIVEYINMKEKDVALMRKKAFDIWNAKYNSSKTGEAFLYFIDEIMERRKNR